LDARGNVRMRSESTERSGSVYPNPESTRFVKRSTVAGRLRMVPIRSFFPVATLVIVLGAIAWGPWVSLALTGALWFAIDALENDTLGDRRT
jgi:hypothetical protein